MKLINKLIVVGETFHLDLVFYIFISLFILFNYYSFVFHKVLGLFILSLGYLFWILGLYSLGDSFQIRPEAKRLVDSGIYSKIRNPIYLGSFLVGLGILFYVIHTLLFWFILLYTLILTIIQFFRVMNEGRVLQKRFGKKYLRYRKKTFF